MRLHLTLYTLRTDSTFPRVLLTLAAMGLAL